MKRLSRRTFLRGSVGGTAVALGLPPLEAMLGHGARAQSNDPPWFGVFYWANGTPWHGGHGAEQGSVGRQDLWTPEATGPNYPQPQLLRPLTRHAVSVVSGLEPHTDIPPQPPGQGDGHMRGFMVALTGDRPRPEGFDHPSHTLTALRASLDQYVAKHPAFYGSPPAFRTIEAGVSNARFHAYGHWNAISFNGPDSMNLPVMLPSTLYDRLFAVRPGEMDVLRRPRLLDAVLGDARSLRGRLGARDRERLDAHLAHLDALRGRLEIEQPVCTPPERPTDRGGLLPRTEMMAELLATAVNCGLTRVFSFQLTSPASTHVFSNLGVPDGMHKTCHDGHWERVRDITRHQMEAFAVFLDAFAVAQPDGSTLLDRGLVYGTTEYGEGWQHSVKELPVLLAGRAGGALRPGVHVRRPGGNLALAQLTALRAIGLPVEQFGWNGAQTSDVLPGLLA